MRLGVPVPTWGGMGKRTGLGFHIEGGSRHRDATALAAAIARGYFSGTVTGLPGITAA